MPKRITVVLTDKEFENLNILIAKYGGKPSSYFRVLLKEAYEKEFGGYKQKKSLQILEAPEEQLTDEQFCEKCNGKVINKDNIQKCALTLPNGAVYSILLEDRKDIEGIAKQFGLI